MKMDNQQERLEIKETLVCKVCGKLFQQITSKHLKHHSLTTSEYLEKFPGSTLCTNQLLQKYKEIGPERTRLSCEKKLKNWGTLTPHGNFFGFHKKYPGKNPMDDPAVVKKQNEKRDATMLEKYGVINPSHSTELREKRKKVLIEKYGTEHIMHVPEIKAKARKQRKKGEMNKIENFLFSLAPTNLTYVGDSSKWFTIEGKIVNPDFLVEPFDQTNSVIEVYGNYWHYKDNPQDRIDLFAKIGIKCLVIWGSELDTSKKREVTKLKVEEFLKSSTTIR